MDGAGMMWPESAGEIGHERADWAVVFVHGIGQQVPGSTLSRFGPPIVEYADSIEGQQSRVEYAQETCWLTLDDGRITRRWLLVEAHWDDVVAPPTYRQLLRWMVLVVPWILHSDALLWSSRRPRRRPRRRWWAAAFYYTYVWGAKLMWAFIRGMAFLISGVVAQLVLTVVGLIGLVPALRGPARWLQRLLIGSVGDSFAYLYDEATWGRIERRLVDTVESIRPRAQRVAVVTHSQGTAVMHRALGAGLRPDWIATWISLGSGLQKLIGLREVTTRVLVGWAILRALSLGFFLASIPFWRMGTDPETGEDVPSDLTSFALLVGVAVLVAPYRSVRRRQRQVAGLVRRPLSHSQLHWLDLYTFHDPVPGGPIPGTTGEETEQPIASIEVHNEGSFLRDHSAYLDNVEEVVRRVYELLDPPRSVDRFAARQLAERRARRVRLRRVLWALTAGLTCALSVPVVRAASSMVGDVLAIGGAGLLSFFLVDRTWRTWNARATALTRVDPAGRTQVATVAWMFGGASFVALLVVPLGLLGVNASDYDGVLRFVGEWGRALTLIFGPLTLILLVTLDFRAYEAARRGGT